MLYAEFEECGKTFMLMLGLIVFFNDFYKIFFFYIILYDITKHKN